MQFLVIDLFAGAGGATEGIIKAQHHDQQIAKVIAAVNHSQVAIDSHRANHPEAVHFTEDIRTLKMDKLKKVIEIEQAKYPDAYLVIWASVECTNYSKAKGGLPRDPDSRTLPEALYRYVRALRPDYLMVENVTDFLSWGEVDENGRPVSMKNGRMYLRWKDNIEGFGYRYDHRVLNAADFGAHTKRERYFGIFARNGHPIAFPHPTHAKSPKSDMFGTYAPWKPVKEVLDFSDEGQSIFERKKPLVNKTLERIYAGLVKYVAGGKSEFVQKHFSGRPKGKVYDTEQPGHTVTTSGNQSLVRVRFIQKNFGVGSNDNGNYSIDVPARTITTREGNYLVECFLTKYHGKGENVVDPDKPASTVTTKDRLNVIKLNFLDKAYRSKDNHQSVEEPSGTVVTNDKHSLASVYFIDRNFSQGQKDNDPEQPAGSVTTVPKMNLVTAKWVLDTNFNNTGKSTEEPANAILACRKHHYLMNPQFQSKGGDVEDPSFTLIARMDKKPPYLVSAETGHPVAIAIYEDDPEIMVKIKEFMAMYGIVDIKMRMLKIIELLQIQGFPQDYILRGNKTQQKWLIGNAVHPVVPEKWFEALGRRIREQQLEAA